MRFSLYLGLLVYIGTVLPLYSQDITALQERLIAKKEEYQMQAAKLREANQKVTHLKEHSVFLTLPVASVDDA